MATIGFNDEYTTLIQLARGNKQKPLQCFFVKVNNAEGNYVDCELTTGENTLVPFTKVPVVQSPYISPIVKSGDFGLLLNVSISLDGVLADKIEALKLQGQNYFVFLPLIKDADYKSTANVLTLSSEDLKSKVELSNEKLSATLEKDLNISAKGKCELTANSLNLSASGADPLAISNSIGGLGDVITQLFTCLDALAAGLTGASSNPAAYNAAKPVAQQMIKQILK